MKSPSRVNIRICRPCQGSLFGHSEGIDDETLLKLYSSLQQYKTAIEGLLPRFQDLVIRIKAESTEPLKSEIANLAKIRKRLLDAFAQFDSTAKKIAALETGNSAQLTIQRNIHRHAAMFLQIHMVPLQSMSSIRPQSTPEMIQTMTLSELEAERARDEAQIELMTFKEQFFLLSEQVAQLTRRRKFDELGTLRASLADLETEIKRREVELG